LFAGDLPQATIQFEDAPAVLLAAAVDPASAAFC
jgi:hypothetical protein